MRSKSEQSGLVGVVEKRKPVTVAQCVFNIVLYSAYAWASAHFALHTSGAILLGLWSAVSSIWVLFWLHSLHQIRRGNHAEYVFVPIEKHKSPMGILFDRFCSTSIAILLTAASICLLYIIGFASFTAGFTILLVNVAAWRGAYQSWTCDRAYKKEPKIKFASEESAEQAKSLEKAPVTVGVNVTKTAAGHWWTDTPLREENQQRVGR